MYLFIHLSHMKTEKMKCETYELKNGIRLVHMPYESEVAHCGIIINTGSRDENEEEHGLAHFIEHLLFKGTKKRSAYQVLNRLESVGGEINAYTTKEETCVYTSFLKDDYERSLELMSDIVFNSAFPENELKKEKEIIIDEINSYKDNPAELIFDDFEELIFKNSSIARNILGTKKNLKKFTKSHIESFIKRTYQTNQMVISSVGSLPFGKLVKLVEKHFGYILPNIVERDRNGLSPYIPQYKKVSKKTYQAHCIVGNLAYDIKSIDRAGLVLLNNILGGPGFNSRLNLIIREKYGYAYNVESIYNPYSDTGIFCVYIGLDKDNLEKTLNIIYKEFEIVKNSKLTVNQLKSAKKQLIGQIAINSENKEHRMISNGKKYLIFNRIESFEEIKNKIENISSEDIIRIANDILLKEQMSTLIYY